MSSTAIKRMMRVIEKAIFSSAPKSIRLENDQYILKLRSDYLQDLSPEQQKIILKNFKEHTPRANARYIVNKKLRQIVAPSLDSLRTALKHMTAGLDKVAFDLGHTKGNESSTRHLAEVTEKFLGTATENMPELASLLAPQLKNLIDIRYGPETFSLRIASTNRRQGATTVKDTLNDLRNKVVEQIERNLLALLSSGAIDEHMVEAVGSKLEAAFKGKAKGKAKDTEVQQVKKLSLKPIKVGGRVRTYSLTGPQDSGNRFANGISSLNYIFRKSLAEYVADRMGNPTDLPSKAYLRYQTGRFANSAVAEASLKEATKTRAARVEILYKYMRRPYYVFNPKSGSALASQGRDPNTIIQGAIRDLLRDNFGADMKEEALSIKPRRGY